MIVTAHQPNYLPGINVLEKVRLSDAVIWLDEVQYSHGGWSNRNRMPDGSWLTVPIRRTTNMAVFNRVRIAEGPWQHRHVRTLRQHYGHDISQVLAEEINRPHIRLIGLNLALLRILLEPYDANPPLHNPPWHFQSHLDGSPVVTAVSEEKERLEPISSRLAQMVSRVGGDCYLSGPSGRNYLDERPFHNLGIEVFYYEWTGPSECGVANLRGARV
jgi:WbqC-like protein family